MMLLAKERARGVVVRVRIAQIIIYFTAAVLLIWVIVMIVGKCAK